MCIRSTIRADIPLCPMAPTARRAARELTPIFQAMTCNFRLFRDCRPMKRSSTMRAGFSLIELCVVILIIGVVVSIAFPQFAPLLIFSELDAEARRLAHYGSGVVAEAALFGSEIIVYIDLDAQEYYATRMVYPQADEDAEETVDQLGVFSDFRASGNYSSAEITEMLNAKAQGDNRLSSALPEDFDPAAADAQMYDRFDTRHRQLLYARAQNVKHDAGFLSEIGPLFEQEFTLSWTEPYEEELSDPLLGRYKLPESVRINAVRVEDGTVSSGVAQVDVSPLGLSCQVTLYLRNEDGDVFTVDWSPLTGRGVSREGKWE
ncbi:MAG TPA: prepilin-type N-terminal cleavage/methylation domain-containing protein [Candidatus Hydrogenedentes bacterium]|nr:prepilin-type N-terminal cleavage/methylation domain-containing protein [Candidatus Hydrogenedentota bacterium]